MDNFFAKFSEYGLTGISLGALFFIVWRWQCWTQKFIEETRAAHNAERQIWHELDTSKLKVLDGIVDSLKKHDEKADERGRYIREEHQNFAKQMNEVCSALGRINGFKEH